MTMKMKWPFTVWAISAGVVAASWVCAGAAFITDAPKAVFVVALIAAALATEGLVWLTAALLGWTAFANRHWLLGRFLGRDQSQGSR